MATDLQYLLIYQSEWPYYHKQIACNWQLGLSLKKTDSISFGFYGCVDIATISEATISQVHCTRWQ